MILNETVATKPDWISLHSKTLDGGFELRDVLEASDTLAHIRVRVLGDASSAAYASFYLAEGTVASEQLQVWQDLRNLKHPNLKSPLGCGRLKLNGSSFIYVVCAMPDETLSEILGDRGLTDEEGKELLKNLGHGLLCLHTHGFAHGALSPEMAVAVGESIQISTECTRRINSFPKIEVAAPRYLAPEVTAANVSMAADIWCLGATVFESLVQKKYETTWFGDLERLALGPTLQRCLDSNPHTRARLSELVDPPAAQAEATQVPPSARAKPVKVTRRPIETKRIRPLDPTQMELVKFDSAYGLERLKVRVKSDRTANWRPIVAGVSALILLVVVIWLVIIPKLQSISEATPADDSQQQPKSAWPTRTLGSADAAGTRTEATNNATAMNPAAASTSDERYRFVIGDYQNEEDADRRIENLNKIHPDLAVQKFSRSSAGPFYVVAGPLMTQSNANELRKKALRMGIARTSYVTDFSN